MEPFLNKFVSLVIHLLESSHKVQIVQSGQHKQVSLFCSKLSEQIGAKALVLNVNAQSFLNNFQQEFFLDWAADQFEELLTVHKDKFDSPWLITITQAELLDSKVISQLLTLKHQRENAQLHLLFHLSDNTDVDTFLSGIDDPIVVEKQYHIHSLPNESSDSKSFISRRNLFVAATFVLVFLGGLFYYHPEASVQPVELVADPAELFTDNSLGNWSDETEEKVDKVIDQIEQQGSSGVDQSLNDRSKALDEDRTAKSEGRWQDGSEKPKTKPVKTQGFSGNKGSWSWQLIAFNSLEKAQQYQTKHCKDSCIIARNKGYYVVLLGQYASYKEGFADKELAYGIIDNPWLRNTSDLVKN